MDAFEVLPSSIVGRGAYGEISLVRRKEDREIFALKRVSKASVVSRNHAVYARSERDALALSSSDPSQQSVWLVRATAGGRGCRVSGAAGGASTLQA